jgi:hypothetical protein
MGKIMRTWSLMAECWKVLRQDKALLIFPLISGICCILLLASFAIPIFVTGAWHPPGHEAAAVRQVLYYGTLLAFYFCNYFIVVFFNAAIIACATQRMNGGKPTVGDGFRVAVSRLPVIIGWALVMATVGLALRIIEERSSKIGEIVAGILGAGWTLVTFLVVPIIVIENKNPFVALKDSTVLLKRTWGEQLASNFSFGMIFFLLAIPAVAIVILGAVLGNSVILIACIVLATLYLILLGLINSALHSIFQAALYCYASNGQVPEGFRPEALTNALS